MIRRRSAQDFAAILKKSPVLMISGPKFTGKSSLAKLVANRLKKKFTLLDCSKPIDQKKLNNPDLFFSARRGLLIILNEIHFMPQLLPEIKKELDLLSKPARFILISSLDSSLMEEMAFLPAAKSSPKNDRQSQLRSQPKSQQKSQPKSQPKNHSPIVFRELHDINAKEAQTAKIPRHKHWFRGGLPPALSAKTDKSFGTWTSNSVHEFILQQSSAPSQQKYSAEKLHLCLQMTAFNNGNILNLENLARSLAVSGPTAKKYLAWLENAFLIRLLPAWLPNHNKRLIKSPKIYLHNTGLLHTLLGIQNHADLCSHPALAASWETYVLNEIYKLLPDKVSACFYRTQHGAETDLVLSKNNRVIACIDISLNDNPTPTLGFKQCISDLHSKKNFIVYPGKTNFTGPENIRIVGLESLLDKYLPAVLK